MVASVDILGSSAAIPTLKRNPSCQILSFDSIDIMLDCGEGAQMRIMEFGLKTTRISAIFITHLHGDHVFGLPGLLSSMALQGRTKPLTIVGPRGIVNFIEVAFQVSKANPPFSINFTELEGDVLIDLNPPGEPNNSLGMDVSKLWSVQAVKLKHRVETYGYIFWGREQERHLIPEKYFKLTDNYKYISDLKRGKDIVTDKGQKISYKDVTSDPDPPLSYAYITDTSFLPALADLIMGISVLYHEATFLHEHKDKARKTMHTTAREASSIAQAAQAKTLLFGHFSARYHDTGLLENEARLKFANSIAVEEGRRYIFNHKGVIESIEL